MAENLKYKTEGSYAYLNNESNALKYGRLYTWYAAENACPAGWRLPSNKDWEMLASGLAKQHGYVWKDGDWLGVGDLLKSKKEWLKNSKPDSSFFNAVPGGKAVYFNDSLSFMSLGNMAFWWSNTSLNGTEKWSRNVSSSSSTLFLNPANIHAVALSIRCVQPAQTK